MRFLVLAFAAVAEPALAQEQDIQRQLIQRQQQSDAFQLQLRQSQERLQVAPGDLKRKKAEGERRPLTVPATEIPRRNEDGPGTMGIPL